MRVALRPSLRLLALIPTGLAVGAVVLDFVFLEFWGMLVLAYVSLLVFVGVGLLLVLRLPRHPVGWLLLGAGTLFQITGAAGAYAWAAFVRAPGTLPLGEFAMLIGYAWIPALGCLFLAIMLFPTGRPPSRRWHLPTALVVIVTVLLSLAAWFAEPENLVPESPFSPSAQPYAVANPLAIHGTLAMLLLWFYRSSFAYLVYLLPVAAVLARFRRAAGKERQQLKWFAYACSIVVAFFVIPGVVSTLSSFRAGLGPLVAVVAMDLIPISVAIAILRYRLYDIDLLIKRTLVYGATTAVVATTFFVGIVSIQAALRPFTSGSELAVAASTLLSFALFQPIRRRVQDGVNRRFDRSRFHAARTVDAFADQLRDEVDLAAVHADLLGTVQTTMAPAHISLWLRGPAR